MRGLDGVEDFTYDLDELAKAIDMEEKEREVDDLGIITMVNDVC